MLRRLFASKPERETARKLHAAVVRAARQPGLYGENGVPDTLEGRFELVVLHAALVILVLRQAAGDEAAKAVSQALFDTLFDDFDAALRELGVGDSAVGKKIRFMAEGFYGRAASLETALLAGDGGRELQSATARNLLGSGADDPRAERLALYVGSAFAALQGQGAAALASGAEPAFPAV